MVDSEVLGEIALSRRIRKERELELSGQAVKEAADAILAEFNNKHPEQATVRLVELKVEIKEVQEIARDNLQGATHESIGSLAPARALHTFAWFCPRSIREAVRLAADDMKRDFHEMAADGRSASFIRRVLWWQATRTVIGFTIGGLARWIRPFRATRRWE